MTVAHRTVKFGNTLIPFAVHTSARRETIAISVEPSSLVTVTAPRNAPDSLIDQSVQRKASWVLECWDEQRRRVKPIPREFVGGETFRYLGRGYRLTVRRGSEEGVRLWGGRLEVAVARGREDRTEAVRQLIEQWYRRRAARYLPPLAERLAKEIGVAAPSIRVVAMRTRWGSCSAGSVRFDWRVMMAPRRLVQYVVAHEICHLRHPDHSRSFWRLLSRLQPDYASRHADLATIGPRLDL